MPAELHARSSPLLFKGLISLFLSTMGDAWASERGSLTSLVIREVWVRVTLRQHLTLSRMAVVERRDNKHWKKCKEIKSLISGWWECKMVQLPQKITVAQKVKSCVIIRPSNPYQRNWKCKNLFANIHKGIPGNQKKKTKNWKQPKCLSAGEQIFKYGRRTLEYYLPLKRKKESPPRVLI